MLHLRLNERVAKKKSEALRAVLKNEHGELDGLLKRLLLRARKWIDMNFRQKGSRFGHPWEPVTWWAAVLRKNSGNKLKSWEAINARLKGLSPLVDHGDLRRSVEGKEGSSIEKIEKTRLSVGTNLSYAKLQNEGGTTRFSVTDFILNKLESTIGSTTGKGAPKRTKGGRQSLARAKWNPLFFQIKTILEKNEGTKRIKARRFIPLSSDLKDSDRKELEAIAMAYFKEKKVTI